jgi:hypothetical protein
MERDLQAYAGSESIEKLSNDFIFRKLDIKTLLSFR